MGVFDTLGELVGKAFKGLFDNIAGLLKFKDEQLSDIDRELAEKSMDPDKYENPDVKKLVEKLKKSLAHSPASLSEWVEEVFTAIFSSVQEVVTKTLVPFDAGDFESAKANAGYLSSAFAGFILLASTLDAVGVAMTGTLVRNIFRYIAFMLQFFGFQKYMDIAMMPAVSNSVLPKLDQGYKAKYQAYWPPVPDWVRYARRDIFSKEVVDFYDYMGNYPAEQEADVAKTGMSPTFWKNEWMAHWRDIEWSIANLLMHRGEITPEQHGMMLRTANYPPGILDMMTRSSWDLPNRIELRMMARYGLIGRDALIKQLELVGLREDFRGQAADMMLSMGIRTDLSTRYSKGWLTKEELVAELKTSEMSEAIQDRLYKWIVKNVGPEQIEDTRTLTKTEIYKGVKTGIISPDQGVELLMDMGYDRDTAAYLLEVNVGVLTGSPDSFEEFKKWTQDYRIATGKEAKPMPEEIKIAAAEVVTLTKEVEALTESVKEEEGKLIEPETAPEEAAAKLKELRVSLHRAESAIAAAKDKYEALVAEWRHKE